MSRHRTKPFKLFTLCIVLVQIFALTAAGVLTALQPTPPTNWAWENGSPSVSPA